MKLTIITLAKNNLEQLKRTVDSIKKQVDFGTYQFLILDGSNNSLIRKYITNTKLSEKANIEYFSTYDMKIFGIYPSMNYGIKKASGDRLIFINSGDIFSSRRAIALHSNVDKNNLFFSDAKIIGKHFQWSYPGLSVRGIDKWLNYFEPNHQSISVPTKWAKSNFYDESLTSYADKIWKRTALKTLKIVYYPFPLVNFYLGGISNFPKFANLKILIKEKKRSYMSKFIISLKYIFSKLGINFEFQMFIKHKITKLFFIL